MRNQCHVEECGKEAIYKCNRCKEARYCSKSCRRDDWKRHKPSCIEWIGSYQPLFTNNCISGHDENDLIILYANYEEIAPPPIDHTFIGQFVPQWFATECISHTRGKTISAGNKPTICATYQEMETMGRNAFHNTPIEKVKFFHTKEIMLLNGTHPFGK